VTSDAKESVMTFKPFLRPNKILAALERGETPLGMQMYTHDPDLVEIVGYTGFDFVMLDMEHNRTNPETMVHLIRAAEVAGLTPLVRVGANDVFLIRSAVESGAQGIVVPHVKTADEARAAMTAGHYPPEGRCGICPAIRASGYSQANWEEYMAASNRQIMCIPLLEDVEAIDNAEEIIGLLKPGRDAVGVGGADIANVLLKEPGEKVQWAHPYLKEANQRVKAICEQKGIPIMGMAFPTSDRAGVEAAKANGTKIVIFYPDSHIFYEACRNIIRDVRG
jgi:2-keto-3-deoxy-L-rhamnonate aldolase RhmA